MALVDRVATPHSDAELVALLGAAHLEAFGSPPSRCRLAHAWAQVCLENGRGKSVWNHNLGNITAGPNWKGDHYRIDNLPPPDPPSLRFRAHDSPEAGAVDYWKLLAGKYAPALARFDVGDTCGGVDVLGPEGLSWFLDDRRGTACGWLYGDSMLSLVDEFGRRFPPGCDVLDPGRAGLLGPVLALVVVASGLGMVGLAAVDVDV